MSLQPTSRIEAGVCRLLCCAILLSALLAAGCASHRWPQIDPSGESLLIWPDQAPVTVVAPPAGAPVVAAPTTAPPLMLPPGNVQAAPVFSDVPARPLAPAPTVVGPPVVTMPAPSIAPAAGPVPVVAQSIAVPPPGAIPVGQDHLGISPDRLLAPVGSEVVLKARVCSAQGYMLKDRRVEWLLDSNGPGKFVDVAERHEVDVFRWVWDTPRKLDNWYVIGATSGRATVLTRGTPDPCDDIPIRDGEAWVSVTSASEGTSRITAYAPSVSNWQFRQASATIFWVDAQWVFAPSAVVEPGRPHVLTTTVSRRTDGSPLSGWIVRYESSSGASLGYDGGNFVEVPTDANGRASVEISPSGSGGGSTTVGISINRPPQSSPDSAPRLEIGRGVAVITWGAGAPVAPAAPMGVPAPSVGPPAPPLATPGAIPAPGLPVAPGAAPYPFTPSTPSPSPAPAPAPPNLEPTPRPTTPGDGYTAPRNEPAGRAQLDVTLRRLGTEAIAVGDYVRFEVTVTNRGDGTARRIEVRDRFDRGLSHPSAKPGEFSIEYLGMRDLAPSDSATLPSPLTFQVTAPGQQCHEVTVSAEGVTPVTRSACISTQQSTIELTVTGERRHVVGETAAFNIVVRNTGAVAATNLDIVAVCEPGLTPTQTEREHEILPDGSIRYHIDRLEVNDKRTFRLEARCTAPGKRVCNRVTVTSGGQVLASQDSCPEILPPLPGEGGANAPAANNLQVTLAPTPNPARVGEPAQILVVVTNVGQQIERQVALRILLPAELVPQDSQIQPAGTFLRNGQELQFSAAPELGPNQRLNYSIPVRPTGAGNVSIQAQVMATGLAMPVRGDSPMSILSASL